MSSDRAKAILTAEGGHASSEEVASSADAACQKLVKRLARLVGLGGAQALAGRSLKLTQTAYPWLKDDGGGNGDRPWAPEHVWTGLRAGLMQHSPDMAIAAFTAWLSNLVELLTRLIGPALVVRVVHELWPGVFPRPAKEST